MPQLLARALVESGAVAEETLNEALQRQVVFGGSLDTNVFEVSTATEDAMLGALGTATGLPTAGRSLIDEIGEHIPRLFPLVFAETYHLVPFRLAGHELSVLLNQAPDHQLLTRIGERLQLQATAVATTEVRLHYAMHRLYGTALQPRYANLLKRLDGELPASWAGTFDHVLSWGLSSGVIEPAAAATSDHRHRGLDVRGVLRRLDAAADRDSIVEALLGATLAVFEFAGVFAVHGELVNGWRGQSPEVTQHLVRISLNVELPSVFQTIYATGGHYLGPLPPNSINSKLLDDMGRTMPRAALLAPISIGGKLAAILYADNGPRGVSSKRVAAVLLLAQRAGMAFERLIRQRKTEADAPPENEVGGPTGAAAPFAFGSMTIQAEGNAWVARDIPSLPLVATDVSPRAEMPPTDPPDDLGSVAPTDVFAEDSVAARAGRPPPDDTTDMAGTAVAPGTAATADEGYPLPAQNAAAASSDLAELAPVPAATDTAVGSLTPDDLAASVAAEPWGTVRLSEAEGSEVTVEIADEIVLDPEEFDEDEPASAASTAAAAATSPHDGYTMFAEVGDSPKQALDDWQDVLIETAGLDGSGHDSPRRAHHAPASVTWDDVIAEAERAAGSPVPVSAVEVAGTIIDTRELLYDSLEADNPEARHDAIEKLLALGATIDDELLHRFPGRLTHNPLADNSHLPPFRACSGLLELIAARGAGAAPIVLPHLESPDALRRLFAIYYLYAVSYPPALGALARRLYDAEPKNRYLAAETLRIYAHEPGYMPIVQSLREQLRVPVLESQVAAVQILGQLREPTAVPSLIPLVVAKRPELAGAAASALTVICGQSFGNDVARWAQWWQDHYNRPRPVWLIESVRHNEPAVAHLAHSELVLLSGNSFALDLEADGGREQGLAMWESWWSQARQGSGAARP